jgi:nucleoprotein TPR
LAYASKLQEKFQTRIQDMQKARAADGERVSIQQQAAVTAAVDKLKSELQASDSSAMPDDIAKAHAEELRSLQARLVAEHQKQLQTAVDAAKKELPSGGPAVSEAEQKVAIAAAIAAHDKELESRRQAELQEATESGRREADMKGRLKDAQLLRTQTKLKEKEALILGWQNAGLVPKDEKPATPAKPATAHASSAVPPAAPATSATTNPPLKPGPTNAATPQATRGMRGGPRGLARGAARGLSIRGAAPGRGGTPSVTPSGPSGVSIMGAAGKRPREEADGAAADDSLVKRLKPAEGTSKPVAIRRPPPP